MIEQLDPLAKTALWAASMRAREHDRSDRLFHDPLARILAGEEGLAIMRGFEADVQGSVQDPALAVRTRFLDDALGRLARDEDTRQVVLVAAGMDTRAFRMTWPLGTTMYELDRASLLSLKDRLLSASGAVSTCTRISVGVDLTADWTGPLLDRDFNVAADTAWLVEGLFYFMTIDERDVLVRKISDLSSVGCWLLADYVSQQQLESPTMRAWREQMANKNHAWQSGAMTRLHGCEGTAGAPRLHIMASQERCGCRLLIRAGQAAFRYSWRVPPSRSRRRTPRRPIRSGSVIGSGSGHSGAAARRVRWGRCSL